METLIECSICHQSFPETEEFFYFHKEKRHGRQCKTCRYAHNLARSQAYQRKLRQAALNAYGSTCACCGESTYEFLGIDHINGGGGQHREELRKAGTTLYLWLRKEDYPEGFRVLCHNCNMAMGFYGECPHSNIKL